jgi:hypothetical protein
MEERKCNVSFSRAGNGIGARIILSVPLLRKLGITQEEREVIVSYDEENEVITIRKDK